MNKILEQSIGLIAPFRCISCKAEGSLLCYGCADSLLKPVPSRCYRCHKLTKQSSVCASCRSSVKISHAWVAAEYRDAAKQLIYKIKFDRAKAGCATIAEIIADYLPYLPKDIVVTHIPTANNRVRIRGYDQAELIAEALCKQKGWQNKKLLIRRGKSRQVGSGRRERFKHLEKALGIRPKTNVAGRHILLIDDVTTSGATIEAAAKILKKAGAKTIDVAVFAQP